jgi:hypothetical protein
MQVKTATNSTEMQTDDLVDFAQRLGWKDEQIIVFAQDLGRSGRLRIDEREGLRTLVAYIEAGTIKAVIVFLEDRLFRDETQIQVNTFISICKQHGVLVITPAMTYNFDNRFHVKEFRWKCEAAADYLTDYVMARLVGAKQKVSERGEYDGRALPVGYILDRREWVEVDGVKVKNSGYKRYMEYEPHAKVVRWLYYRYMMLGGNLSRLCREIKAMPVLFPDFTADVDSRNITRLELKRVEGGYHVTRKGLISILTNVSYLGWWVYQGQVKIKGNHPAIVDEDLFWYAFNRLSDYTLEGTKNERKKRHAPRYERQLGMIALLKNIIGTELLGSVYVVPGGKPSDRDWFYALHEKDLSLIVQYRTAISVSNLDSVYVSKLLERLRQTSDFEHYRTYAEQERQSIESEKVSVQAQIDEIDRRCEGIMLSLQRPTLVGKLRDDLEKTYESLQQQRVELVNKLEAPHRSSRARELLEYQKLVDKLAPHWDSLSVEDRIMLAEALTERVLIDSMAPHWMRIIVQWRDPQWGSDIGFIWRRYGSSHAWAESENEVLREHYATGDRASLLALLPDRSWSSVTFQANLLGLHRNKPQVNNTPIPKYVTHLDWVFMQENGIEFNESWGLIEVLWTSGG